MILPSACVHMSLHVPVRSRASCKVCSKCLAHVHDGQSHVYQVVPSLVSTNFCNFNNSNTNTTA